MASRVFNKNIGSLEKNVVMLFGDVVLTSAGAVGTLKGSGIKSITKQSGAGLFKIVLEDGYNRLLMSSWGMISASGAPSGIAAIEMLENLSAPELQDDIKDGEGYQIQLLDFAGAAANPAATCVMSWVLWLRNSEVKGKGE